MTLRAIAFDLDDTLLDTGHALVAWVRAAGYDIPDGDLALGARLPPEAVDAWHALERHSPAPLVPGALEACRAAAATGARLYVVTAREPSQRASALDMVAAKLPGLFEDVICVGQSRPKSAALRRIGAGLFTDDTPRHVLDAEAAGIPSILFGDLPWNAGVAHARRAPTWAEGVPMLRTAASVPEQAAPRRQR